MVAEIILEWRSPEEYEDRCVQAWEEGVTARENGWSIGVYEAVPWIVDNEEFVKFFKLGYRAKEKGAA